MATKPETQRRYPIEAVPSAPGTYVLILCADTGTTLQIGRLGTFDVAAGWYAYVGSAFGSGGLRGRIRHHLAPVRRPHWHIDWFRTAAVVREVWYAQDAASEHGWASDLLGLPESFVPIPRFGASDCACVSHLIGFPRPVQVDMLRRVAGESIVVWAVENSPRIL
ncbi:MAG: GIY-YIG nuclease family protein [Chloroflexi bacterium]|nr:GIY-YIG nuclease family protein [Chloroflexota bacterium]